MVFGDRFDRAFALASSLHRHQTRKGTPIPYITHLMAVAAIVGEAGGSEDEVIAALLHDSIEDQGGQSTREIIQREFGPIVAEIVEGCTDTDVFPKPPWKARKQAYIEHLKTASDSVRLVSLADKLHNARSIVQDLRAERQRTWAKFNGGRDGTLWYYRSLVEVFRERPSAGVAELSRVVAEMILLSETSSER